jgi:hypothetical protein
MLGQGLVGRERSRVVEVEVEEVEGQGQPPLAPL